MSFQPDNRCRAELCRADGGTSDRSSTSGAPEEKDIAVREGHTATSDSATAAGSASAVRRLLADLDRRVRHGERLTTVARVVTAAVVLSMCLIAADAVYELDSTNRVLCLFLYPVVIAATFIRSGLMQARRRPSDSDRRLWHFARAAEVASDLRGNELINAVMLSSPAVGITGHAASVGALRASLLRRVVAHGEAAAARVIPGHVAPRRQMQRALATSGAVILLGALLCIPFHRAVAMGAPRFVFPFSDAPAFTWLDFEIETNPSADDLLVGDDITIGVTIRNRCWWKQSDIPPAEAVQLLRWKAGKSGPAALSPMAVAERRADAHAASIQGADAPSRTYQVTLRSVQQPITVAFDTPAGRSQAVTMTPLPVPRIQSISIRIEPPAYVAIPYRQPREVTDPGQPIRVYPTGGIDIRVRASMPDCGLELARTDRSWSNGPDLLWDVFADGADPTGLRARCAPAEPGRYEYAVSLAHDFRTTEGVTRRLYSSTVTIRVLVVPDEPPTAEIIIPDRPVMCLPDQPVTLRLRATDDLGLSSVVLSAQVIHPNPDDEHPYAFELDSRKFVDDPAVLHDWTIGAERRGGLADDVSIDLSPLGLTPGDMVSCRVTARDEHPDVSAHCVASEEAYLLIIDPDLYGNLLERMQATEQATDGRPSQSEPSAGDGEADQPGQDAAGVEGSESPRDADDGAATSEGQAPDGRPQPGTGEGVGPPLSGGELSDSDNLLQGRGLYGPDAWPIQSRASLQPANPAETQQLTAREQDPSEWPKAPRTEADPTPEAARGLQVVFEPWSDANHIQASAIESDLLNLSPQIHTSLRLVPSRYRDLASRYFLRLLREEEQGRMKHDP